MTTAVVVSGGGRYADPWHPFAETSAALADIVARQGVDVRVDDEPDRAFASLDGADLLVVNVGRPAEPDPEADARTRAGLLAHLASGRPLLVAHVSVTSLTSVPEWESVVGGTWVDGTTMHPDLDRTTITVHPDRSPLVAGIGDFAVEDERYSFLRVDPRVVPLLSHEHDGVRHPLFWTWRWGSARVAYDALGHDPRSYESAEHREILGRAVRWLLADR